MMLMQKTFSSKGIASAGNKCVPPGEARPMRDCLILLPSRFPCSPRDSWREPRGAEEGGRESSKADLGGRLLRAPCWRNLQSP